MSAKNLKPVESLIALVIVLGKDAVEVKESGKPILQELSDFQNIVTNLPDAISAIHDMPGSLSGFDESDAEALVAFAMTQGLTSNAHATDVINKALAFGSAGYALIMAIKAPAAG